MASDCIGRGARGAGGAAKVPGRCPTCGHGGPQNTSGAGLYDLVEGNHWCLLGRTGRGKSHLLKELIGMWLQRGYPVVAWDPEDELSRWGDKAVTSTLGPLRDRATVSELCADPDKFLNRPDVSLAVVLDNPDEEDSERIAGQFLQVTKWIRLRAMRGRAAAAKPLAFVLEEVGAWANPHKPPAIVERAVKKLVAVATLWRKRGVVMILCAQIMPLVPRAARSQVSKWVCFQLPQAIDRRLLAAETDETFAGRTRRLKRGEYVVADVDKDGLDDAEGEARGVTRRTTRPARANNSRNGAAKKRRAG